MANKVTARKGPNNFIVSTGPDVCLTPMGSSMVPVAYNSIANMENSVRVSTSVLHNSGMDFQLNSRCAVSQGHEPGTGKGVVIPGYKGMALVTKASHTVGSEGYAVCRHRDPAMINRPGSGGQEPESSFTEIEISYFGATGQKTV